MEGFLTGKLAARAEAWGRGGKYEDEKSPSGVRLLCSDKMLRDVLAGLDKELLLLIKLRRYEERLAAWIASFHTQLL